MPTADARDSAALFSHKPLEHPGVLITHAGEPTAVTPESRPLFSHNPLEQPGIPTTRTENPAAVHPTTHSSTPAYHPPARAPRLTNHPHRRARRYSATPRSNNPACQPPAPGTQPLFADNPLEHPGIPTTHTGEPAAIQQHPARAPRHTNRQRREPSRSIQHYPTAQVLRFCRVSAPAHCRCRLIARPWREWRSDPRPDMPPRHELRYHRFRARRRPFAVS